MSSDDCNVNINRILNKDCLFHVLKFLPFADKVRFQRVCKQWRSTLVNVLRAEKRLSIKGNLWKSKCCDHDHNSPEINNLAPIFKQDETPKVIVSQKLLENVLKLCPSLKSLQLIHVTLEDAVNTLMTIGHNCSHLECLNLYFVETKNQEQINVGLLYVALKNRETLRHLYLKAISNKLNETTLANIFQSCDQLEIFDIENSVISLTEASLVHLSSNLLKFYGAFVLPSWDEFGTNSAGIKQPGIDAICRSFGPYLTELRLSGIDDQMLSTICRNMRSLTCLELYYSSQDVTPLNFFMIGRIHTLNRLVLSVIRDDHDCFDRDLLEIIKTCPKLKTLVLSLPVGDDSMMNLSKYCPNVETLALVFYDNPKEISDKTVKTLANLKNLKVLDLWFSTVTDEGCVKVINSCPQMKFLGLRHCRQITNVSFFSFLNRARINKRRRMKFCHYCTRISIAPQLYEILPDNLKIKDLSRAPF